MFSTQPKSWFFLAATLVYLCITFPYASGFPLDDAQRAPTNAERNASIWTRQSFIQLRKVGYTIPEVQGLKPASLSQRPDINAAQHIRRYSSTLLHQRAPGSGDFNNKELETLRWCAVKIAGYLKDEDIVFFLGNSGSYLLIPFELDSFNMHSLPISGTRDFETKPEDKPTQKGLERYYKKVLHPKLTKTEFNRIVLVDHSGGGGFVDGFRKAFHDMVQAGNPKALDDLMKVPMVLINVIDELRKDGGPRPVIKPKDVQTIAKFFPPGKDHLNKILDGKAHPRVTPKYPPPQWETPIKDSWKPGQQAAAARIEKQVKEFCAKNGGLVKDKEPPKPKKQSAPWWLKFMKYTLTR